jgi:hypothetical protein
MSTTTLPSASMTDARPYRKEIVLALARVETARLLRHPAFLIGLAATIASLLRSRAEWATWDQTYNIVQTAWVTLWMGTLAAAALAAGRQRFLAEPDLFPAVPANAGNRALATALALIGPTAVAAFAVAVVAVVNAQAGGFVQGDEGYSRAIVPSVAEWAQPVLLVALAGVVGIALAQLRRARLAVLVLLLFATFVGGTLFWAFQGNTAVRVLHPYLYSWEERSVPESAPAHWDNDDPPLIAPNEYDSTWREVHFATAALNWHLVYIAGLILLGVWLARRWADRGADASARWLGLTGILLALVGGVAQILAIGASP